jgi:hypothetical protein
MLARQVLYHLSYSASSNHQIVGKMGSTIGLAKKFEGE